MSLHSDQQPGRHSRRVDTATESPRHHAAFSSLKCSDAGRPCVETMRDEHPRRYLLSEQHARSRRQHAMLQPKLTRRLPEALHCSRTTARRSRTPTKTRAQHMHHRSYALRSTEVCVCRVQSCPLGCSAAGAPSSPMAMCTGPSPAAEAPLRAGGALRRPPCQLLTPCLRTSRQRCTT